MPFDLDDARMQRQDCREWTGDDDKDNPRNWPLSRKVVSTMIICMVGFVTTMGASIYAPGHEQVKREFGVSTSVSLLPLSSYSLGLAFGPMISSPLSETFGRKFVYLLTVPLFDVFIIGTAFSQSIASLIICRFFAGMFAAPGVSVAAATITDYTYPATRAIPLAAYYTVPFIGSAMGPLIGSFIVENKGWRWTQYTILFFAAAVHPATVYLRESYKTVVLQRMARKFGMEGPSGPQRTFSETIKAFLTSTVLRPLHMMFSEPLVGFVCLYCEFQFALLYAFVVAIPWVFANVYGFSVSAQGLVFLGLIAGCSVAPFVLVAIDLFIYQPRRHRLSRTNPTIANPSLPPEDRLLGALYGSLVLPIGLFWYAWTARTSIHWICPTTATGVSILGSILVYVPCNFFMLEVYGSKYGASSSGASSLTRYVFSAAFPLFVIQMYQKLGVGWATSLLGFVALAMAPIPWVFYWFGPRLRARSAYEHGT